MNDFFTHLAAQVLQPSPGVFPAIPLRFAPGVDVPGSRIDPEPPPLDMPPPRTKHPEDNPYLQTSADRPAVPKPLVAGTVAPETLIPALQTLLTPRIAEEVQPAADQEPGTGLSTRRLQSTSPEPRPMTPQDQLPVERRDSSGALPAAGLSPTVVEPAANRPQPRAEAIPEVVASGPNAQVITESSAEPPVPTSLAANTLVPTSAESDKVAAARPASNFSQPARPTSPEASLPPHPIQATTPSVAPAAALPQLQPQTKQPPGSNSQPEILIMAKPAPAVTAPPLLAQSPAAAANSAPEIRPAAVIPAAPQAAKAFSTDASFSSEPEPGDPVAIDVTHPTDADKPGPQLHSQLAALSQTTVSRSIPQQRPALTAVEQPAQPPELDPRSVIRPALPADPIPGVASHSTPTGAAEPAAPTVRLTIGRIVVKAMPPAAPAAPKPAPTRRGPAVSLSDYLARHGSDK